MDNYSAKRPPQRSGQSLRDVVCDVDKNILRLLMRRYNLLRRMRNSKGFLEAEEERNLRASWQKAAAGVSCDARLSVQFFSLMQELEFFPKADEVATDSGKNQSHLRAGFNLAPAQKPVRLNMRCPLNCRATRGLLMLAAMTGSHLAIEPCLMNDPVLSHIRMLNQMGANLVYEKSCITAHPSMPLGTPDKALHVGDSSWNFFLILAHYLWRPSRVKLSGDSALKLADFSAVRNFVPVLGARLAHVIPRSHSLPVRLECSGNLPEVVPLPHDVSPEFGEALLLTAHANGKKIILNIAGHPQRELIQHRLLFLLSMTKADITLDNDQILLMPGKALIAPETTTLPMELEFALFLLAISLPLGGEVNLNGLWPQCPQSMAALQLLQQFGLDVQINNNGIRGRATRTKSVNFEGLPPNFPPELFALPLTLAACIALQNGEAFASILPTLADSDIKQTAYAFLQAIGLTFRENGRLCKEEQEINPWIAPDPTWALAFALAACAHPHLKLGNPSILSKQYPEFWTLYNALPNPTSQKTTATPSSDTTKPAQRRRVISPVLADIPQQTMPEEPPLHSHSSLTSAMDPPK